METAMTNNDKSGWVLVVRFEDQSPSYCHGFEAGKIWRSMEIDEALIETTVMGENLKTLQRMADAMTYEMVAEPSSIGDWHEATFRFIGSNPVKKRLSVIPGGLE